jgi:endogenous inhibitor of DNA gyrase (YacG/DUF329 family)
MNRGPWTEYSNTRPGRSRRCRIIDPIARTIPFPK